MRAHTELALGLVMVLSLTTSAALLPRATSPSSVSDPAVISALTLHHHTTAATVMWMGAVQDFGTVVHDPTRDSELADRLHTTTALDPSFTHAHIAGALMLRVAAPSALPAFVEHAQAQRPDLPWKLLETP